MQAVPKMPVFTRSHFMGLGWREGLILASKELRGYLRQELTVVASRQQGLGGGLLPSGGLGFKGACGRVAPTGLRQVGHIYP